MRHISIASVTIVAFLFVSSLSCTRVEISTIGDDLIPEVDNINTFETYLEVKSDNLLLDDSTRAIPSDDLPIGEIFDDPEFGQTVSNAFFTIYPNAQNGRPFYPFYHKDSITSMDSVILQLAYTGIYGDSFSSETFRVEEISQSSNFSDSSYRLGTGGFQTAGQLGSKTFSFTALNDSIQVVRKDTTYVRNVLRIPLNTSFGTRLASYDTTMSSNGGYRSDSIFRTLVRGFAVKVDSNQPGNKALAYFNLSNTNTRLLVYYKVKRNGKIDTAVADFQHAGLQKLPGDTSSNPFQISRSGRSSTIRRNPQHGYALYLSNGGDNDDLLYLQTSPGSYGLLKVPGLDTMENKVIHRAELYMAKLPALGENVFTPPDQLWLDMISHDGDSVYTIQNDFELSTGFLLFGGTLKSDKTYRFNLSRHVQGIVTRKEPNYRLRVYAPYETDPYYYPPGRMAQYPPASLRRVQLLIQDRFGTIPLIGYGRVVLGGGSNTNLSYTMRLRVIYSKI